jgi:hypothetical protein
MAIRINGNQGIVIRVGNEVAEEKPKKNMKNKGVSFNLADPHQKELYNWACKHTNFSSLVKRLLADEMAKKISQP